MTNKQWLALINEKRDEIITAGEQAFKDSVDNQHLQYHVELYCNGDIDVWHQSAGGNSFTSSSYKGNSICLMTFCNQYLETNVPIEDYIKKATEKGIEIDTELKGSEIFEFLDVEYHEIITECENEWLEWYKDEDAYQEADCKLDRMIENLENSYN